jgi:hypothetical protein
MTDSVLRFMQKENLSSDTKGFEFRHMCYLLKDKAFF